MISVIVVDDENIARRRLARLLEETGEARIVAECAGGRDAVEQISTPYGRSTCMRWTTS